MFNVGNRRQEKQSKPKHKHTSQCRTTLWTPLIPTTSWRHLLVIFWAFPSCEWHIYLNSTVHLIVCLASCTVFSFFHSTPLLFLIQMLIKAANASTLCRKCLELLPCFPVSSKQNEEREDEILVLVLNAQAREICIRTRNLYQHRYHECFHWRVGFFSYKKNTYIFTQLNKTEDALLLTHGF